MLNRRISEWQHGSRDLEATDARRQWKEEDEHLKLTQKWLRVKTLPTDEFHVIKVLGRGFYGAVKLVKDLRTGNLYAMKTVRQLRGPEDLLVIQRLNNEHSLLLEVHSVWVERMFHSFQDHHFYFELLEYIPEGSLAELLQQEGTLQEHQTKFYGAEMLMAINALHRHGFMHRNIRPSNFLLDQFGHVKITDFGCAYRFLPEEICQKMSTQASIKDGKPFISRLRRDRIQIYQRKCTDGNIGSTDFMAPEVARPRPTGFLALLRPAPPGTQYSFACDFWSFGVCLYQMLFGQLPFRGDNGEEIRNRITSWRENLSFPVVQPISDEAKDLMMRLLCDEPNRLGTAGCEDVMSHVFFEDIDWLNMRNTAVPVPYGCDESDSCCSDVPVPDYILELLRPADSRMAGDVFSDASMTSQYSNMTSQSGGDASDSQHAEGNWTSHNLEGTEPEPETAQTSSGDRRVRMNIDTLDSKVDESKPMQRGSLHQESISVIPSVSAYATSRGSISDKHMFMNVSLDDDPTVNRMENIKHWIEDVSDIAEEPPDDLHRIAQEHPEELKEVVLETLPAKEIRKLSQQKEKIEREESKKSCCVIL